MVLLSVWLRWGNYTPVGAAVERQPENGGVPLRGKPVGLPVEHRISAIAAR